MILIEETKLNKEIFKYIMINKYHRDVSEIIRIRKVSDMTIEISYFKGGTDTSTIFYISSREYLEHRRNYILKDLINDNRRRNNQINVN